MTVFLGRDQELRAAQEMIRDVAAGHNRALIVVGEAGTGKSRLLVEGLAGCNVETLHLRGHQLEQGVPFAAAREMLLRLADQPGTGTTLRELLLGEQTAVDSLRLFEAAHLCLRHLSPALVVLDDLQWVDSSSLALVHYLLRAGLGDETARGLLVAARPGPDAVELEQSLLRSLQVERIELGPLDRQAGATLAQYLDVTLTHDEALLIWARAGGSPFWLEVLAAGEEREVERLLGARLERSGPDASSVAAVLAIASRPLPMDVVGHLLAWSSERVEEAVRRLFEQGLIRVGLDGVSIYHDLVKDFLVGGLPERRARELHRTMAEWLEESSDDLFALSSALVHRRAAGEVGIEPARRLLESSRRHLLSEDAVALLRQVADEAADGGSDIRWHLASLLTEQMQWAGALREWSALAEQAADGSLRARAALQAAEAAMWLHRYQECRGLLSEARLAAGGDPVLAVELDAFEAGLLLWVEHRPEDAMSYTARALEAVPAMAGRERAAEAHFLALGAAYDHAMVSGDLKAMLAVAEQRVELAANETAALMASYDVAMCLRPLGRLEEAETRLASIWEQALERVLPRVAVEVGPWLAYTMLMVGRLQEASEVAGKAVSLSERLGGVAVAGLARRTLRLVDLMQGEVVGALHGLENELEATSPHYRIGHYQALAWWWARLGGPERADSVSHHVERGLAATDEVNCQRCRLELMVQGSEALARVGRRAEAGELLAEADNADGWVPLFRFWRMRAEAALAADTPQAVELWREAVNEGVKLGVHVEALWAGLDLARELEVEEPEVAVEELIALGARAEELGVVAAGREADQRLRAFGIRTWRRGARRGGDSPADQLTDREWEVAGLLATGASNPDIASALFLSRKTVERHVSNVLVKLGARNRAEAAALVAAIVSNEGAPR